MKDRNKILSQLLIVAEEYDLEIINIEFKNINSISDEIKVKFKIEYNEIIVKYIYETDNMYEVNAFICCFKIKLDVILKEE